LADFDAPSLTTSVTPDARQRDDLSRRAVRRHFDRVARQRTMPPELHRYYYEDLYRSIRSQVPPGSSVLDLGCGDGTLLASLRPSRGVGIDFSFPMVVRARRRHPHLEFVCGDVERLPVAGTFDYVIASNVVGYLLDVQEFFQRLQDVTHPSSRVLVAYYNFAWEPLLWLAAELGLKAREPIQSWLSNDGLSSLVELTEFEVVKAGYRTPIPIGPAPLTRPLNHALSAVPLLNRLGLISLVTARPRKVEVPPRVADPTCTVVIPARNERGNVQDAIRRMPPMGRHTEVIFVEGHSTDGTYEEIERVIAENPGLDIKATRQDGSGKGDAVRKGFELATGDVLMILDADLTVPPEDLPKFWSALVEERGEFINGTRLVYPMEDEAMRLANLAGNKVFSLIFSWILGERITDTLCGTKVLWASDYRRIAANRAVFGEFDPFGDFDLLFGAAKLGLKIREVPVRYRERTYGTTNIDRWRHGLLLARMAWIGARRLRFG
jgi:SAM-dependent methyltransferase